MGSLRRASPPLLALVVAGLVVLNTVRLYSTGGGKGEERDAPDAAARRSSAADA